ncbi:MAG: BLUF domain-containing protein [Pseudomonadota bacterium]
MALHRLIYTSTATDLLHANALDQILGSSRTNNNLTHITGLLIYHEGCFLQVLEGEVHDLARCFRRIKRDPRHTNCIRLVDEVALDRLFDNWRMAYWDFEDLGHHQKKQFVDIRQLTKASETDSLEDDPATNAILRAFLSSFRDLDQAV